MTIPVYAQDAAAYAAQQAVGTTTLVVWLAIVVLLVASMWRVFERAGQPGWMAIVPILNLYVLIKIAGKSGLLLLAFIIPVLNIVAAFIVAFGVAARFRRGQGFGIGLALLPFIFYPILAFGEDTALPQPA
ncbi:MAG: signal peptidase I [Gemmatimonadaceae bacterium]|nr:signal peptidase I [Gemmatimonadaceae bacterium]NUQ91333.1 signal peptidase I [Gemmatimonadaceae bacterium]NUR18529.1 signal peptidase I [Gemmatimonadaceae bacterium]NUS97539.1 signal peptidase I [Gemmatimonadaceae bacterium]